MMSQSDSTTSFAEFGFVPSVCVSLDVGSSILILSILPVARVGEILGLTFEVLTFDATLYPSIV